MKKIKIHCIQARADRLNQPEMVERYREMAITWDGDTCELIEEDHEYLNTLWNENEKPSNKLTGRPCSENSPLTAQWASLTTDVLSCDNNTWKEELAALVRLFDRNLTPCQIKARKKRFIERFRAWEALQTT